MVLLLFDIDGTLLVPGGVGRRLIEDVLGELCGRPMRSDGVSFSGRTDPDILCDILRRNGFPNAEPLVPVALGRYVRRARGEIGPSDVAVLPGVRKLLERLSTEPRVQLALLTGNHRVTAYLKLAAARLATYFPFGAFGSDDANRRRLPAVAIGRARARSGYPYAGRDLVIVGDSEHDIACAKHAGARSVAVCSGLTGRATLARLEPDLLLDDLTDVEGFCRAVLPANRGAP